ncbi:hypothetical protein [Xanthomarina spongicola]|uniref:Uncharacterized protein n=1 Tax=Xanthomarina spongicola TaxID=570520 RepID=A0A316DQN9_9FLAO|nr:hypothetical protein [Xanthomarina spongicola]PWK20547.1 hypothetical protein LX78_00249 [Xanthomarina spongicola]
MKELLAEISELLLYIKKKYPVSYKYLDENPITIPNIENPNISTVELEKYLALLKDLIAKRENKN